MKQISVDGPGRSPCSSLKLNALGKSLLSISVTRRFGQSRSDAYHDHTAEVREVACMGDRKSNRKELGLKRVIVFLKSS